MCFNIKIIVTLQLACWFFSVLTFQKDRRENERGTNSHSMHINLFEFVMRQCLNYKQISKHKLILINKI